MIIAIDGPAASGKGTLGKRLAHHYGYRHLDTGVIYRAVAKALLDEGFDLTDEARAVAAAMELDPEKFGHPELKTQRIGDAAFFRLLPTWTRLHRYGNANTDDFVRLAEKISGKQLDDLFRTWLFTTGKPAI